MTVCRSARIWHGWYSSVRALTTGTRLTEATPGLGDRIQAPEDPGAFDVWDPANISPLIAYLATEGASETGNTYYVMGGTIRYFQPWTMTETIEKDGRWSVAELQAEMPKLAPPAAG